MYSGVFQPPYDFIVREQFVAPECYGGHVIVSLFLSYLEDFKLPCLMLVGFMTV